jgi:general secretion pathway protein G
MWRRPSFRSPRRGGFTLIELVVVIAILGLIAAVVAVSLPDKTDRMKWNLTATAVGKLKGEVELFRFHENRLPDRLDELVAIGQLEEVPRDAWGRAFLYRKPGVRGAPFDIVSYGADGEPGGTGVNEDLWSHRPR